MAAEPMFDFEWDPVKAQTNQKKPAITFDQAASVFLDPLMLTTFDEAHSQQEERWHTMGHDSAGRLVVVSHTFRETGSGRALIRLITAREATRNERQYFENEPR